MSLFSILKAAKKEYGDDAVVDSNGHITTGAAIRKREAAAKKFGEDIGTAERILGRNLTVKEEWRIMQRGDWRCACCGDSMYAESKKMVVCPTCYLRLELKDNKINCIGNMEKGERNE